jgi:hypothetical protein
MRTLLLALALLIATVVPAGAASWERVEAPSEFGRAFVYRSAAAFGEQDAWAVGWSYGTVGGALEFRSVIQRWDGASWAPAPKPVTGSIRELLFDVSAAGPERAWAVGFYAALFGLPPTRPLVLAWDGAAWSLVEGPAGFGGALTTVAAAPDGTVWIGGEGRNPETGYTIPSLWLRAGSGWQATAFPSISGCATSPNGLMVQAALTDIASRGPRATWATGWCTVAGGSERGFLARFNGKRWFPEVTADAFLAHGPRGALTGTSISPDGTVWAVGWSSDPGAPGRPLAFRGTHSKVRAVPAPEQGNGAMLYAVAAERDGAAVAAGTFTQAGDSAPHPHTMGASGTGLAVEPADLSTVGNLFGVALSPGGTAWAVGVSSWDDRGLIMRRTP